MAFLFAAFGPVVPSEWACRVRGSSEIAAGFAGLSDWHDEEGLARLGVLDANGGVRNGGVRAALEVAAIAVGLVEGSEADSATSVLEAYGRARTQGLASLRGDYAYALWDGRERCLYVGCDAVGLRAPAYTWDGRTFFLATRALALVGHVEVPLTFDPVYLAQALSGAWGRTSSATAFEGVRRMVGGEMIRVSSQGIERLEGARLKFRASPAPRRGAAVRELAEALDSAVANDSRNAASCVALSGGVDSAIVATVLAKGQRKVHALSLVAPDGAPGDAATLARVIAAFPGIRLHSVQVEGDADLLHPGPLSDDPICSAPILQTGRTALLRAAKELGFQRVFNGEGGDEVFDMAWRPGDLIREAALDRVVFTLGSGAMARRTLRDFVAGGRGPLSEIVLDRARKRFRAQRPWLRAAFWESSAFDAAWQETMTFARLRNVRERLPAILGVHGRYWRSQELARLWIGVEGRSPMLRQAVVELVGSMSARTAMDLRHGKALLRRLAAERLPAAVAWRAKDEPLSDWLVARWTMNESHAVRAVSQIRGSRILAPLIDVGAVLATLDAARKLRGRHWLASSLVELAALTEWVTAVEARSGP
jgi:asparagine synthase (glutamine-hydrolysing)